MIIRKLFDNRKDTPVTLDDVPTSSLTRSTTFDFTDSSFQNHRFKVAEYDSGKDLVQGKYIKDRTLYKGSVGSAPIQIYDTRGGDVVIDEEQLVHNIYEEFGEGRVNIFKIGGNPPRESIFENKFIKKIL